MVDNQTSGTINDRPRTVAELLEWIARERGALERAASAMDDEHLAHVAAWERRLLGEMRGDGFAGRFGLDEDASASADTDTLNAMIYARHRHDSPATVRSAFFSSGEALRTALNELRDADLVRPVRPGDSSVETLVDLISWDTYKHYPPHAKAITDGEAWPRPT
jgi:hypothetical protein